MTANVPATILGIKKLLSGSAIGQCDLVRIYISVIRPVVEYACPAWHTKLPQYVSDNIELIQKRCMKTIFPGCSYNDILEMTNLPTLHDRRTSSCRTYFNTQLVGVGLTAGSTNCPIRSKAKKTNSFWSHQNSKLTLCAGFLVFFSRQNLMI